MLTERTTVFRAALERRRQMRQASTHAFVADDLGHPQNPGRHAISTQSGALSRAPLTLKDRPQPRPENISNCRWVRTSSVGHRAVRHPTLEQSGYFRKLGEERQLPQRRCAPVLVPANLEPTARCIHPQFRPLLGLLRACAPDSQHQPFLLEFRLPHRVTLPIRMETPPAFSWPQVQERQTRKIGSTATHAGTAMPTAIISGAAASAVRWPNLIAATDRADDHGSAGSAPSLLIGRSDSAAIAHGMVTRLPAGPTVGNPIATVSQCPSRLPCRRACCPCRAPRSRSAAAPQAV